MQTTEFGAYLGGIETGVVGKGGRKLFPFGAYLGGIETSRHPAEQHAQYPVWSLPRRD